MCKWYVRTCIIEHGDCPEKGPNPEEPACVFIGAVDWARAVEREGNAVERAVS
jgi:hypothetical protein